MNFGHLRPSIDKLISLLTKVERHTRCASCGGATAITTAGASTSVPAGLRSVAIVKTSSSDTVTITLSDSTTYVMTEQGEVFIQSASGSGALPAYTIAGPGTWKWHGIK